MRNQLVFEQVCSLFLPIAVGYLVGKCRLVEDGFEKGLSALLFHVLLPCTIVSALRFSFAADMVWKSGALLAVAVATILLSSLAGLGVARLLRLRDGQRRIALFSLAFSNFSFMGYPMAEAFFGAEGVFYAAVFSIPIFVFLQSLGMMMLDGRPREDKRRFRLSYVLNAPMVAVVVGLALFLTRAPLPSVVEKTVSSLGSMTTTLSMILAGLVLTKARLGRMFSDWKDFVIVALRLVILPLALYLVLSLFGLDEITTKLPVVISMMPVAANLVIMTTKFGGDAAESAKIVLLSTVCSLVTIPLMGRLLF